MFLIVALALQAFASPTASCQPSAEAAFASVEDKVAEYEKKREEAGKDVDKLWKLYLWCDNYGLDKQGRSCLRAVIKVDEHHREAHEALGHLEYNGEWFTSQKKLDKYKAAEELRIAKEQGLVKYHDEWVSKEDLPYLKRGMTRDDNGDWVNKEDLEKQQAGWVKQDLVWVSPEEAGNIEKGLWKCGDAWLTIEKANEYHSELGQWWIIPTEWFTVYTTADRDVAMKAVDHMGRAYRDVHRALGQSPDGPVVVTVLRNNDQYGAFAAGSETQFPTEVRGLSSVHWAYFADSWFLGDDAEFLGSGVGYWDASSDAGNSFGIHSVRHAATLSLLEAADPSPKALSSGRKSGFERWNGVDFWREKKFPEWYRFGIASYVDRYFIDQFAASDKYNWARDWSIQNLMTKGGLRKLEDIFEAELNVDQMESSIKLMNELGLVMAFVLDGKNVEVAAAFGAVKHAIREGKGQDKAFSALSEAIIENEAALREFAGI